MWAVLCAAAAAVTLCVTLCAVNSRSAYLAPRSDPPLSIEMKRDGGDQACAEVGYALDTCHVGQYVTPEHQVVALNSASHRPSLLWTCTVLTCGQQVVQR